MTRTRLRCKRFISSLEKYGRHPQQGLSASERPILLSAGIFTRNLDWAMRFVREVHGGNLMVNWGPQWRVVLMPCGGLKMSGFSKEGPRYAVEEMRESKKVMFHL